MGGKGARMYSMLMIFLIFVLSSPAFSIIDFQVLTGVKDAKVNMFGQDGELSGTETKISSHIDPIPLVPVAFGASLLTINYNKSESLSNVEDVKGLEYALELFAWVPLQFMHFRPYPLC